MGRKLCGVSIALHLLGEATGGVLGYSQVYLGTWMEETSEVTERTSQVEGLGWVCREVFTEGNRLRLPICTPARPPAARFWQLVRHMLAHWSLPASVFRAGLGFSVWLGHLCVCHPSLYACMALMNIGADGSFGDLALTSGRGDRLGG